LRRIISISKGRDGRRGCIVVDYLGVDIQILYCEVSAKEGIRETSDLLDPTIVIWSFG
jgi:hypothetical protein